METKEKIKIYEHRGDAREGFDAYECYSKAKAFLLSEYPIDNKTLKRLISKQNAVTDKLFSQNKQEAEKSCPRSKE